MSQNATPATRNEASRRLKPPKATTFAEFQGVQLKLPPRAMTNFASQNALLHKPVRFVDNMFMLLRQPWETFGPDNISQQPRSPPILELKPRLEKALQGGGTSKYQFPSSTVARISPHLIAVFFRRIDTSLSPSVEMPVEDVPPCRVGEHTHPVNWKDGSCPCAAQQDDHHSIP